MKNAYTETEKIVFVLTGISLIFWLYYLSFISWNPQILYLFLWLIFGGIPMYYLRGRIAARANSLSKKLSVRFFVVSYTTVLFEEIFAAFVNNLHEGFTPLLFSERILQFWAFNIFAFSGIFVAWFLLRQYFLYSNKEVFYLSGIFGIYVELLSKGIGDVFSILLLATPMMFVYGLIVAPMSWITMPGEKMISSKMARYTLPLLFIFICSLPFIFTLNTLRCAHPSFFPPSTLIPNKACNF